jgi:hypothetical protein
MSLQRLRIVAMSSMVPSADAMVADPAIEVDLPVVTMVRSRPLHSAGWQAQDRIELLL